MGGGLTFVPDRDEAEIVREYLGVWDRLYEPSRFLARTYKYFLNMCPAPPGQEPKLPPPKILLRDILVYLELSFRNGLKSSHRAQYWRQFLGLLKANPARVPNYIEALVFGQDMFRLRSLLHRNLDPLRRPAA